VDVPTCLEPLARLEVLSLTAEDLARTQLYAQERRRRESRKSVDNTLAGQREYLASLQMKMRISLNDPAHLTRLSQLTQKTNQFNLTTRRYDERRMQGFVRDEAWLVADFSLADVFGDSGIVGLALLHCTTPHTAELDTFLMSCRVIGREAESAFLHALLRYLAARGVHEVTADFLPTRKNDLAKAFLPEHSFEKGADGRYRRDLGKEPPQPEAAFSVAVELFGQEAASRVA
jgi:FkbH-like protein